MNNRRSFLSNLVKAAACFSILPAATTYSRKWIKPAKSDIYQLNPEWEHAHYEARFLFYPLPRDTNFILPIIHHRSAMPPELVTFDPDKFQGEHAS